MDAPTRPRILLVDDDEAITTSLGSFLERSGYEVRVAGDGAQGLRALDVQTPDLVVSDVLMPHMDGREFLRRLRQRHAHVPVILLTQVGESGERSAALDEGADDYLNKPFDPQELVSRIRAVLRRTSRDTAGTARVTRLTAEGVVLDRTTHRVWLHGREIALTPKAHTLLEYLMTYPGEVHTRDSLLSALWGFDVATSSRAVDHRIAELRRVLGDAANAPRYIDTAAGVGYRFIARVDTA